MSKCDWLFICFRKASYIETTTDCLDGAVARRDGAEFKQHHCDRCCGSASQSDLFFPYRSWLWSTRLNHSRLSSQTLHHFHICRSTFPSYASLDDPDGARPMWDLIWILAPNSNAARIQTHVFAPICVCCLLVAIVADQLIARALLHNLYWTYYTLLVPYYRIVSYQLLPCRPNDLVQWVYSLGCCATEWLGPSIWMLIYSTRSRR